MMRHLSKEGSENSGFLRTENLMSDEKVFLVRRADVSHHMDPTSNRWSAEA